MTATLAGELLGGPDQRPHTGERRVAVRRGDRPPSAGTSPLTTIGAMELESIEFKIVMDDGPDTEVLARAASLDIASAAYRAAVLKHPKRDLALRHGARIIKRHDGAPNPEPPRDPNLKSWSAHLIGGSKMQLLGFVEAIDEAGAIDAAAALFGIDDQWRKRPAVNLMH
jgi:hypothetical protein